MLLIFISGIINTQFLITKWILLHKFLMITEPKILVNDQHATTLKKKAISSQNNITVVSG